MLFLRSGRTGTVTNLQPANNVELMRRMVAFFRTGDLSGLASVVSSGYVDHQGVGEGELLGTEGFASVVDLARKGHSQLDVEIEELNVVDELVVAKLNWIGPAVSRESVIHRRTIEIVRFRDGLAVEHWGSRLD